MFRRLRPARRRARPRQQLKRAQRLFEDARYEEAAPIFQALAAGAARQGMLEEGANLFSRAAQCYLEIGRVEQAVVLGKRSLRLLGRAGQMGKVRARWTKMLQALEQKGYHDKAAAFREEGEAFLSGRPLAGPSAPMARAARRFVPGEPPRRRPQLPDSCPHCGAPVDLREVTWAGPDRVECAYCSGIITAATEKEKA